MKRIAFSLLFSLFFVPAVFAGHLFINSQSSYGGNNGFQLVLDDTAETRLRDNIPYDLTHYTARFYVKANCLTMLNGDSVEIFSGFSYNQKEFGVVVEKSGGKHFVSAYAAEDNGGIVQSPVHYFLADGWHAIEVEWKAGSGNGSLDLDVDNWETSADILGLDNVGSSIAYVELGSVETTAQSVDGSVFFDEFSSQSDGPIGMISVFDDVSLTHPFWPYIHAIYGIGVTSGCSANNYCPNASVTRDQMAVFLLRSVEGGGDYNPPPCSTQIFNDVPCGSSYARWINELYSRGITAGCGSGNYCPTDSVTRGQMAVFLLKAFEGDGYVPPACTSQIFDDVPCSHYFSRWINELYSRGITAGCGANKYCPNAAVSRGAMAVFLVRTFNLSYPLKN